MKFMALKIAVATLGVCGPAGAQIQVADAPNSGLYAGVGMGISVRDGGLFVASTMAGGPAKGAGIVVGDRIISVDGRSMNGLSVEDASKALRGRPGSEVQIMIERKDAATPISLKIRREYVPVPSLRAPWARRALLVGFDIRARLSCDWALGGGLADDQPCGTALLLNPRFEAGAITFSILTISYELEVRIPLDRPITEFKCKSRPSYCISEVTAETRVISGKKRKSPPKWALLSSDSASQQAAAQAFNTLVALEFDSLAVGGERDFELRAAAWRASDPKPLSPEGDKHRVLGENAFREKDVKSMISYFEAALYTDPTWPDGNFNLALALGENAVLESGRVLRSYYWLASHYMKRYLLLLPTSPNAKAAREKIIIWEDKARNRK